MGLYYMTGGCCPNIHGDGMVSLGIGHPLIGFGRKRWENIVPNALQYVHMFSLAQGRLRIM